MIERTVNEFAKRLGVDYDFNQYTPLCFTLAKKYSFCIEYTQNKEKPLVVSVEFAYDRFDEDILKDAFEYCNCMNNKDMEIATSVHKDNLMFMCSLKENVSAIDIENTVLGLISSIRSFTESREE